MVKELIVLSGKGGTGKTSIAACFAALAENKVLADADVDAPDLFILLEPRIRERESFRAGYRARIRPDKCIACGDCRDLCRCQAIGADYVVDEIECEGCGVCAHFCPAEAVELKEKECGEWFISDTRHGPLVHAKLGVGEENSGKLVSTVRHNARLVAEERGLDLVIVDGPPGIGCPVISAITGAHLVLIVTEPTLSALHDMRRVAALTKHFAIPTAACINKCDLNPSITEEIIRYCQESRIRLLGRVPYDPVVSRALVNKRLIVEHENGRVSAEIQSLWGALSDLLFGGVQGVGWPRV
jgi:MinD superfamily P-loop ATPase